MQINASIEKINATDASLRYTKTKTIVCPFSWLPKDARVGQRIVIEILTAYQYKARQKNLAQAIIDEILGDNAQDKTENQTTEKTA